MPQTQPATIVHGDYKLDNVMWDASGKEPHPIALFDWEMSTLGDPLADLGWMVTYWSDPADDEKRRAVVCSMDAGGGYYTRQEMIELYERKSGRVMGDFAFYEIFSLFKLAIIGEASYARYLSGQADDPVFATYDLRIPQMADVAWSLCEKAH
jgi:aminoglycoside phosphotransferase (APT) family kinase protein